MQPDDAEGEAAAHLGRLADECLERGTRPTLGCGATYSTANGICIWNRRSIAVGLGFAGHFGGFADSLPLGRLAFRSCWPSQCIFCVVFDKKNASLTGRG